MSKLISIKENNISSLIHIIRGEKVILDYDLAALYEVETRALKQAVRRNIKRFPEDFMFILSASEWKEVITNCDNPGSIKFSPAKPFAFTEQGVAMLSSMPLRPWPHQPFLFNHGEHGFSRRKNHGVRRRKHRVTQSKNHRVTQSKKLCLPIVTDY